MRKLWDYFLLGEVSHSTIYGGIVKTSFGKFYVLLWDVDIMTVSCLTCRYLRSHGEFSIKTART